MPTFYLVRHGAKEKVMGDPPLSELGREQAKITGNVLKQHAINSIFSSPLLRAKQTAEIIGEKINLPFAMDQRLVERMNWGDRKKETFEEFWEEWERSSRDRKYQPKHGDSSWAT